MSGNVLKRVMDVRREELPLALLSVHAGTGEGSCGGRGMTHACQTRMPRNTRSMMLNPADTTATNCGTSDGGNGTRIAALVKTMSAEIPVLLVEHDIDRVFQIADHVTVMNEGHILVDGTVEVARNDAKVREVYIGSGAATVGVSMGSAQHGMLCGRVSATLPFGIARGAGEGSS